MLESSPARGVAVAGVVGTVDDVIVYKREGDFLVVATDLPYLLNFLSVAASETVLLLVGNALLVRRI